MTRKTIETYVIVSPENLCNYRGQIAEFCRDLAAGRKIVLSGRRNSGKSSFVLSGVRPAFRRLAPDALIMHADLMDCQSVDQLALRLQDGFQRAFADAYPNRALWKKLVGFLGGLSPQIGVDPASQTPTLSLAALPKTSSQTIATIIERFGRAAGGNPGLLILDEFQDIAGIPEAQGLMWSALQMLPAHLGVIILGSKHHLLTQLFSRPRAPFADWGESRELGPIPPRTSS
jgi:GTPase SAR1 family protein